MTKILDEVELEYFRKFREQIPGAILAGGAVRDMVYGLPYTDIDIFFNSSSWPISTAHFYDAVVPKVFDLGCDDHVSQQVDRYNDWGNNINFGPNVNNIVDVVKNGIHFKLTSLTKGSPSDHVKINFDLNACKIYHDGISVVRTKEFKDFFQSKILDASETVQKVTGASSNLLERVHKIVDRYKALGITLSEYLLLIEKEIVAMPPKKEPRLKKVKGQISVDNFLHIMQNQAQQGLGAINGGGFSTSGVTWSTVSNVTVGSIINHYSPPPTSPAAQPFFGDNPIYIEAVQTPEEMEDYVIMDDLSIPTTT